jgi:hypothetical protein
MNKKVIRTIDFAASLAFFLFVVTATIFHQQNIVVIIVFILLAPFVLAEVVVIPSCILNATKKRRIFVARQGVSDNAHPKVR